MTPATTFLTPRATTAAPATQALDETTPAPRAAAIDLVADVLPTLVGPLAVVVDADGVVRAAGYRDLDAVAAWVPGAGRLRRGDLPDPVRAAIGAYADGDLDALDEVPVSQPGTLFQQDVWAAMRRIPPGEVVTYGELALIVGRPGAARAVGQTCARNRVAPFVPCHRVTAAGGGLGGYGYGLDVKRELLAHEARHRGVAT
jgi:methylated-DNA-[protein]-cysteine S-methyltransferase